MSQLPAEPDLLLLLHDVARLLRLEIDRRARLHGMNRAQWAMLIKLARHPGLSQKDLAELLEVEPMSVARLTDRLAARNLVERRADPRDRRIWRLHLTEAARPLLAEIEAQRGAVAALIGSGLAPETMDMLVGELLRIKATLLGAGRCGGAAHDETGACAAAPGGMADASGDDTTAQAEQEMV
ncbi:MarR family winged helix-turn-helix transcriptional regulator [Acidiphilium multivorum]|uniref:MarR family winged helix-turn-helix transcriptional regulator n=1 Tax=Acidiphilium multivorum TaxID=62140 RepID=UPI001B8C6911|nr:MarR family transcriptional regulator [Acidiphilium multivorum]MBS3023189.1 MarR family transcriptional regulator [Acidiphilium multivorum]